MDHRFEEIDRRFDQIDRRFEEIDRRFEQIDHRFEEIDRRFDQIDHRFEDIDRRFDQIDHRFEDIDRRFEQIDHRFEEMESRLSARLTRVEIGQESLRNDVQAVAELTTANGRRIDDNRRAIEALTGKVELNTVGIRVVGDRLGSLEAHLRAV